MEKIADNGAFIEGMGCEDLKTDKKTQYAVIRCLEVIGEAAKKSLINQERSILIFHGKKLAEGSMGTSYSPYIYKLKPLWIDDNSQLCHG
ncbi:MAG: DUF86 domain-containing protein [Deltaproteobacteria bacterium]|nr:DUF86 domain-containing protein [Deltaproteobacteria bacterium]